VARAGGKFRGSRFCYGDRKPARSFQECFNCLFRFYSPLRIPFKERVYCPSLVPCWNQPNTNICSIFALTYVIITV